MMLVFLAILLLAAALCYPYLSAAISKHRMLRRLAKLSRSLGFRFRHRGMAFLSRNRGRQYELLIENDRRIYAVKLWSAYRNGTSLLLGERGRVRERRRVIEPLSVRRKKPYDHRSFALAVPRTRLSLRKKEKRAVTRILLVYPSYREILTKKEGRVVRLSSGDAIFDKLLYSPSALEQMLRREAEERNAAVTDAESKKKEQKTAT